MWSTGGLKQKDKNRHYRNPPFGSFRNLTNMVIACSGPINLWSVNFRPLRPFGGYLLEAVGATITLGNGDGDVVNIGTTFASFTSNSTVSLGNGNNDTVNATFAPAATITVGNGNDAIYVGRDNTITV